MMMMMSIAPYMLMDISKIELVQQSFTKRLPGLSNLLYTKRLEVLEIDSRDTPAALRFGFCVQNAIWFS